MTDSKQGPPSLERRLLRFARDLPMTLLHMATLAEAMAHMTAMERALEELHEILIDPETDQYRKICRLESLDKEARTAGSTENG